MKALFAATLVLLAQGLLTGCAASLIKPLASSPARAAVVSAAGAQVGAPYKYDGDNRRGFDASGLVFFSYTTAGFGVPSDVHGQLRVGHMLTFHEAKPADLLFYRLSPKQAGNADGLHVGIYVGNGEMVHAQRDRDEVVLETVDTPYWLQRFITAVKILP